MEDVEAELFGRRFRVEDLHDLVVRLTDEHVKPLVKLIQRKAHVLLKCCSLADFRYITVPVFENRHFIDALHVYQLSRCPCADHVIDGW